MLNRTSCVGNMWDTLKLLFLVSLVGVSCYKVSLIKQSTLYLPSSYGTDGDVRYKLSPGLEQMTYDSDNKLIYMVGGTVIHAIDVSNPDNMTIVAHVEMENVDFTDVEFCGGYVFTAVDDQAERANGRVIIYSAYNATSRSISEVVQIPVGAVPDMLKPTHDCSKLIVAVEGEAYQNPPNQITDPEGLVVIINFHDTISNYTKTSLNFTKYNDRVADLRSSGVRHVYQENNNPFSNDVEPEYVALNADDTVAYIVLQENNAVATVDLVSQNITGVHGLGYKDWSKLTLDPSDEDRGAFLYPYSVMGMYQSDTAVFFRFKGVDYLLMANEGDAKDYNFGTYSWSEEEKAGNIPASMLPTLDATTQDQLTRDTLLGRLKVSVSPAGKNSSGNLEALYTFGGRSFSIRRTNDMSLVYDSGDDLSKRLYVHNRDLFNGHMGKASHRPFEDYDLRSRNKGMETEAVATGELEGRTLLFVANERPGTIFVYSLDSDVMKPEFHDIYTGIPSTRTKSWQELYDDRQLSEIDCEDIKFVSADKSPTGKPVLFVTGSVSGTLSIINVEVTKSPPPKPEKPTSSAGSLTSELTFAVITAAVVYLCGRMWP
ncbi:mesenchyme-specific cell surface glycoprotein-like [Haliotis rubra]|uniref:mesenchyme-specific cell surface glycoprotein-like n=1 Tax=Haliotis rubra TaxID=36100 RepID=UPI001EE4F5C3|nr:mesenchyme-specific cell surface glycoprotein-like [Haliotis rubra]